MDMISQEIKETIKKAKLCFVATINHDGSPNLSPKASLEVWDQCHVIFAHIESFKTIENLKSRPLVAINVVDFIKRKGFCLEGEATIFQHGTPEYDFIAEPIWKNHGPQYPVHCAVKVKVHSAGGLYSPAYKYDDKATEDNLGKHFFDYYQNGL